MYQEMSFIFNDKSSNLYDVRSGIGNIKYTSEYPINKSFQTDKEDINPYTEIINKLDGKSKKLKYSDFAYLSDLGVYPINRLVILRRFNENVSVVNDLDDINEEPISVLISWISPEDEKMFNLSFHEEWTNQTNFFWDEFAKMVKGVTGINASKLTSLPGWSQGFLYNFLKSAGFVDPNNDKNDYLPVGDPNVLRQSKTRSLEGQGLKSDISLNFKSQYEQKYIKGIDPGEAMLKIISNIFAMGTSEMRYIFDSNSSVLNNLKDTVYHNNTISGWTGTILNLMENFVGTLMGMMSERDDGITLIKNKNNNEKGSFINEKLIKPLNMAIQRYRWNLKSSLALTTGDPTTPWHLTVGNPLNPLLSIGNIHLTNGSIDFGNEMNFNNLPDKIRVSFNVGFGRPLGRMELMDIFNIKYERLRKKSDIPVNNGNYENFDNFKDVGLNNKISIPKIN